MPTITLRDMVPLLPAAILSAVAVLVLLSEVALKSGRRGYQAGLTLFAAAGAAVPAVWQLGQSPHPAFGGTLAGDPFFAFVTLVVCATLALCALASASFLGARQAERGEYYALVLFGGAGMSLLAAASDLVTVFLGLEVTSVATYALAGYLRRGTRPAEAALKYFLLGAFSTALFLFGAALVYGATGKTGLRAIAATTPVSPALLAAGLTLVGAGFAFKVAAVPLHMWAPDVYEGAPTPVTAFMAAGVKAAAFAALVRTFEVAFGGLGATWLPPVYWLAILTMGVGNLLALPQRNVKRLLAYSSVAHAGDLLAGVAAAHDPATRAAATEGVLFYLAAYAISAVGALAALSAVERADAESPAAWDVDRFAGLGRRRPALAFAVTLFMLSLVGLPPAVGFPAKVLIFKAAVEADLVSLAVVGVVTSAVGAYYYLRVVVHMYMREPEAAEGAAPRGWALDVAIAVAGVLVVALGILPAELAELARASGATLGG